MKVTSCIHEVLSSAAVYSGILIQANSLLNFFQLSLASITSDKSLGSLVWGRYTVLSLYLLKEDVNSKIGS